ncbi:MAG: bifunctional nuclease family protein [Vampirovibrionales bacterium]|nr:bifunctional nuclease family protein [Vampirovibrionales bacterium]
MVELRVMGIALDTRTGTPIVVLNDVEGRRALPIWIGTAEASAIIRILENIKSARPMTHDLLQNIVEKLGYKLARVEINDMNADTYFATLVFSGPEGTEEQFVDARPSDAVAFALRADAPIFATTQVMAEGTISTDLDRDEEENEAFRDFLKNVKASDFKNIKFDREIESDQ